MRSNNPGVIPGVWAFSDFQPTVAVCLMSVWPYPTTRVPSVIFGWSMRMAPPKNTLELASSDEPEKSSMLYGQVAFLAFDPSSSAWPWSALP
jgi:hypothetical protein